MLNYRILGYPIFSETRWNCWCFFFPKSEVKDVGTRPGRDAREDARQAFARWVPFDAEKSGDENDLTCEQQKMWISLISPIK